MVTQATEPRWMTAHLDSPAIQDLAVRYFPLAVRLARKRARRLPARAVEVDELIGVASVALMDCLHRLNPAVGTPVSFWIYSRVQTALSDYLRRCDPLTQKERDRVKSFEAAERALEQRLKRKPTTSEVAQALCWTDEDVEQVRRLRAIETVSGDDEDVPSQPGKDDVESNTALREDVTVLHECFMSLTVEERVAWRLHLAGAILEEIAQVLDTSLATAQRRVKDAGRSLADCMSAKKGGAKASPGGGV